MSLLVLLAPLLRSQCVIGFPLYCIDIIDFLVLFPFITCTVKIKYYGCSAASPQFKISEGFPEPEDHPPPPPPKYAPVWALPSCYEGKVRKFKPP